MDETGFYIPYRNGQSFFACEWSPPGKPKAVILLVHGLSDHAGRYCHAGAFFTAAGYAMIIVDLRGNGRSFGKRGHFPSFDIVMDDISLFLEVVSKRHPSLPVILYGHSMGGNLVLNYLIRHAPPVVCAVATSPWLRLNVKPPLLKAVMATLANRVLPSLPRPDEIIPSWLSHDEEVVRKYMADPLVHHLISVRTYFEISNAGEYAMEHAGKVHCPMLLMHGTDDHLTSFRATLELSTKLIVQNTFKPWEGMYHELHNEPEKRTILEYTKDWIEKVNTG
ncbi:MAG: lysophospholipase [Bacteroidetes bacterium]|nr:lysophospholipase [Bacteroidota bacterium]